MLRLNTIKAQPGATRAKKRLGRGAGSGLGQTSGKGDKGQLARTGGHVRAGFEGGQTPLYRRIPKRGFHNFNRRSIATLNLRELEKLDPRQFPEISLETLCQAKILKGRYDRLAVLGHGSLSKSFCVKAHHISQSAQEKIKQSGGQVKKIPIPGPQLKASKKRSKESHVRS